MNKILIILLLCFGLSSCVTTEDVKSVSKKVSNTFSTKKVETSNNQIKEETINENSPIPSLFSSPNSNSSAFRANRAMVTESFTQ